ncbi:MAG: iron-containing redox enzyme family protein [Solirubrobacterales bacterium]|nr:iron-containing redox enzyme family protein [Solirubrobacterales bacterium]
MRVQRLPRPRGPVSAALLDVLAEAPGTLGPLAVPRPDDPLADEDLHLALYLCYELHYRGLPGVDERWEWDPGLLGVRAAMEKRFEDGLIETVPRPASVPAEAMDEALREIAADEGPPLARHLEREATLEQFREFVVHRSAYQLKEADPHSWALPRLDGPPKAALVEIQFDEYGSGQASRIHAALFARAMEGLGLDASYGAYVDVIPGVTLATVNLMSLFGLHRRRRGAIVGHLALFEMTSSLPNRRYARGARRLGLGDRACAFFDEHVMADAVHEAIAAVDLAGGLAAREPAVAGDVLWGAAALAELDRRFAEALLGAWEAGRSSLRSSAVALGA